MKVTEQAINSYVVELGENFTERSDIKDKIYYSAKGRLFCAERYLPIIYINIEIFKYDIFELYEDKETMKKIKIGFFLTNGLCGHLGFNPNIAAYVEFKRKVDAFVMDRLEFYLW